MSADLWAELEAESARIHALWARLQGAHVPLAVAAAMTFHQVHGNTKAVVTRPDYDDALNIAASALARLVPIYARRNPAEPWTAVELHPAAQRFARGATELRSNDGGRLRGLSVKRSDLLSAISLIKRTGLPFAFAAVPAEAEKRPTLPKKV